MKNKTSRRDFIRAAASGGSEVEKSTTVLAAREPEQVSANDKIQIGLIGSGGMGFGDTETALEVPGVEIVAAADVYNGRLVRVKEVFGNHVFTTRDYREVLARPDVDAVIIATPDHWHAQISIDAMNAGKDVYCEKPMVQVVSDGHSVIQAEKATKRILQVGSQGVSSIVNAKARELLAAGKIGKLNIVEAWINRRTPIDAWQYSIPPDATPENIDWDRFLGKARKVRFDPIRLFRWRNYRDYGTGIGGDLFVHLFSAIHFITGSNGPTRVQTTGGLRYWNDGRDVPDMLLGIFDYPETANHPAFNVVLRVNFEDGGTDSAEFPRSGFQFIGPDGVMKISDGVSISRRAKPRQPGYTINTFAKAAQDEFLKEYRKQYREEPNRINDSTEERFDPPRRYDARYDHFVNFFDAVRTRKPVVEDATFGLRAAGPALVSNESYFNNFAYDWDPVGMKMTKSDSRANGR
jgi:predicted dehydrogenase